MEKEKIITAVNRSYKGIRKYLSIMDSYQATDVFVDKDFQRRFNSFYRIRQRSDEWYKTYYYFMQQQKGKKPSFSLVLRYIHRMTDRYEPSFSSKLVATDNPNMPIWDQHVLKNVEFSRHAIRIRIS